MMWLNIVFWYLEKIPKYALPVLVSYPKQVSHSPKRAFCFHRDVIRKKAFQEQMSSVVPCWARAKLVSSAETKSENRVCGVW